LRSGKKGAKKEEQYRTMWAELERLVTAHSDQSVKHHAVLECLMEVRQVRSISFLRLYGRRNSSETLGQPVNFPVPVILVN
jgi:hypothetical protein